MKILINISQILSDHCSLMHGIFSLYVQKDRKKNDTSKNIMTECFV